MRTTWTLLAITILAFPAAASAQGCRFSAERNATLSASGVQLARIGARAGSLRIEGQAGLQEIRVRGTACASSRQLLEALRLDTGRDGGEARVLVEMPDMDGPGDQYASLDLVIEVPETLGLHVTDSSGDLTIRDVGGLTVEDSSGEIQIDDVNGSIDLRDSSGNVEIGTVRGDVRLNDSSGDLRVHGVTGSVLVEHDSSGNIDLEDVRGDAEIRVDSSGDIVASGIRGDFTVNRDTSGGIRYREVAGQVRIPSRKRE